MAEKFKHSFKSSESDALVLTVTSSGMQRCEPLHQWGPGVRPHYLIHHILSGKGKFITKEKTYYLESGDTFLIYPDEEITYIADENEPWEYYWVGFTGSNAAQMIAHTDFTKEEPIISTDFGSRLKKALVNIYKAHGSSYSAKTRMTGYLSIVLSIIMESSKHEYMTTTTYNAYAKRAAEYIRYNYSQTISIEDIAEHIGISRSHLFRAFIERYSMSPKDYLTSMRISAACELLETTELSIGTVANSVGFSDHLYFSTVFKKLKGVSPRDYRKKQGE